MPFLRASSVGDLIRSDAARFSDSTPRTVSDPNSWWISARNDTVDVSETSEPRQLTWVLLCWLSEEPLAITASEAPSRYSIDKIATANRCREI
ncbi:hypothetical protein RRF57_005991 [Xylaria bambusicola]|uniref:Uncharacterized protein n=1 Tax=Xylaria bambusicola TaxID=326684 RepID=A0AAN7Z9K6_9PEZI